MDPIRVFHVLIIYYIHQKSVSETGTEKSIRSNLSVKHIDYIL